jgi:hypothetical protein
VHLLDSLHLVAHRDRCGCGVLVTLGGCHHLDGLEQRWGPTRVSDCSWPASLIVRGLVPSPAESRKVIVVDCSCH